METKQKLLAVLSHVSITSRGIPAEFYHKKRKEERRCSSEAEAVLKVVVGSSPLTFSVSTQFFSMASSSNGGASLRKEIFDMIKQVHCKQNQNLRDVKLSEDVYRRSKNFTRTDTGHRHYYPALDRMEGGGVFGLLQEAAGNASLGDACDLVGRWKEAINSLLRYALNLLLAPNRPELKTVKVSRSVHSTWGRIYWVMRMFDTDI